MSVMAHNLSRFVCTLLLLTLGYGMVVRSGAQLVTKVNMATLCLVPLSVWIGVTDLRRQEIPDRATAFVALIGAALWSGSLVAVVSNFLVAVIVTLTMGAAGGVVWRRTGREWLGLGDVKLIGAGTMVVGWDALWIMLLLASFGGISATLTGRTLAAGQHIPFGPFLASAIFATLLIAGPVP
jgi:prepilin signal peptidase PulO-like enzyme (type II secretory pathway)